MIDGTYNMMVNTPLGPQPATATLRSNGDTYTGDIDAPVIGEQHIEGPVKDDVFTAEGSFELLLIGEIVYKLTGKLEGDKLHITIDSNKVSLELEGTRE